MRFDEWVRHQKMKQSIGEFERLWLSGKLTSKEKDDVTK